MSLLAPGAVLADFKVEDVVGRGGMGVVYQAVQLSLDRPVALKLIAPHLTGDEGFRERFVKESRLSASEWRQLSALCERIYGEDV